MKFSSGDDNESVLSSSSASSSSLLQRAQKHCSSVRMLFALLLLVTLGLMVVYQGFVSNKRFGFGNMSKTPHAQRETSKARLSLLRRPYPKTVTTTMTTEVNETALLNGLQQYILRKQAREYIRRSRDAYTDFLRRRREKIPNPDYARPWTNELYLWDFWPPLFNCPLRTRVGRLSDGGKVVCNLKALEHLKRPCIVYSFGIRDDPSFEEELVQSTSCTVYAFDPSVDSIQKVVTRRVVKQMTDEQLLEEGAQGQSSTTKGTYTTIENVRVPFVHERVLFKREGLAAAPGKFEKYPLKTLGTFMKERGHTHIDLLKVDVEGAEWDSFREMATSGALNAVDQVQIELHFKQKTTNEIGPDSGVKEVYDFFADMEASDLFPFNWEVNFHPPTQKQELPHCIEYSFVRPTSRFMLLSSLVAPVRKLDDSLKAILQSNMIVHNETIITTVQPGP